MFFFWKFIFFTYTAFILCIFILFISYFLGGRSNGISKNLPFESGINSFGKNKLRFSIKFYIVAICFVIFDVESLYLYTWCISIRENGWFGFLEAIIFILFLFISLIYINKISILNWNNKNKKN